MVPKRTCQGVLTNPDKLEGDVILYVIAFIVISSHHQCKFFRFCFARRNRCNIWFHHFESTNLNQLCQTDLCSIQGMVSIDQYGCDIIDMQILKSCYVARFSVCLSYPSSIFTQFFFFLVWFLFAFLFIHKIQEQSM